MIKRNYNQLIKEIKLNLPQEVDPLIFGGRSSILTNAFTVKAGLMHRAYDLAVSAHKCANDNHIAAGKILARALVETVATIGYLFIISEKYIKTKDIEVFNSKLMKLLLGSKSVGVEHQSINVMDCIRAVDKSIGGFLINYEVLSEFSHPNFAGSCGLYGKPHVDNPTLFQTVPEGYEKYKNETTDSVCLALDILKHYHLKIYDIMDELVCEYNKTVV